MVSYLFVSMYFLGLNLESVLVLGIVRFIVFSWLGFRNTLNLGDNSLSKI